tara:strand:- start:1363 stop:1770 length:408 start_codon:yes stop_codon:yes gene_type:complete
MGAGPVVAEICCARHPVIALSVCHAAAWEQVVNTGVVKTDIACAFVVVVAVVVGFAAIRPWREDTGEVLTGVLATEEPIIAVVRASAAALIFRRPDYTCPGRIYGAFLIGAWVVVDTFLIGGTTPQLELVFTFAG